MSDKTTDDGRHQALSRQDRETVAKAIHCLEAAYNVKGIAITSPTECRDYLKLKLYGLPYELFACLLLDNRHRVIRYTELFRGTIDGASVHPREVVRLVLENNAAAVILAHFVPRNKMGLLCPIFLCAPASEAGVIAGIPMRRWTHNAAVSGSHIC